MPKLSQILAVEKGRKTKVYSEVTSLHKATQKPALMNGQRRSYQPTEEEGEKLPPEENRVQYTYKDSIERIQDQLQSLFDVTASKDWANCEAKADIVVNNEVFLRNVPVTYLLFLEKQLTDLHTFVDKMVELDNSEDWTFDENAGLHKSEPITTRRTAKLQKPIVLYPATEQHPAQTQLITEDVLVGYWTTVKFSGAIPKPEKRRLVEKIETLSDAVKFAREQANSQDVEDKKVGEKILGYIFG